MATPTVTASLNKSTYQPGEQMTLTVNYSDTDTRSMSVTVTVSDSQGNTSAPATVSAVIDPSAITVNDTSGHVWTKQSDTGSVAVYTATA